jgi:hypothetical protein
MTAIVMKYWNPVAGRLIGAQPIDVPPDLIAVCGWAVLGLMVTSLVVAGAGVGGEELAGILAMAE